MLLSWGDLMQILQTRVSASETMSKQKSVRRHRACMHAVVVAVIASTFGNSSLGSADSNSLKPVVTRQTTFSIPFHIQQAQQQNQDTTEVQLHVSTNGASLWKLYSRQHPSAGSFHFHSQSDGQLWFAVRTRDRQGRTSPAGALRPELSVIIDTTPPKLNLLATAGSAGEVQTRWEASDERIDSNTMTLEYRAEPGLEWLPVAIDLTSDTESHSVLSGKATWWPQTDAAQILIRAQVKDLAGNTTVVQRQFQLPNIACQPDPKDSNLVEDRRSGGGIGWPVPVDDVGSGKSRHGDGVKKESTNRNRVNHLTSGRIHNQNTLTAPPPSASSFVTRFERFSLEYDLQSVGLSGIRSVQLWATNDSGQTWRTWSDDPDQTSPLQVEVGRSGVYGFRIIVENNEGLAISPPQPGDAPEIWVTVDQTSPQVRLTSAQYGTGAQSGTLEIRWKARDDNLGERPVTLKYTSDPTVGWQTVADNLPNTGQFSWRVDRHVPQQIYLRLEVKDLAGNLGGHEISQPIDTRGLIPKAWIRAVRPVADSEGGALRDPHQAAQPWSRGQERRERLPRQ